MSVPGAPLHRDAREGGEAETAVTEDPRWHARLLEVMPDAVVGTDPSHRITEWNPAAERLYGYSAAEAIGRPARELALFEGDESHRVLEAELDRNGWARRELRAQRPSGDVIDVELTVTVVRDERGATTGFLGIHRDVTDRRRVGDEHRRLSAIVQNSSDFSGTCDLEDERVGVLIVDDHAAIRESIALAFEQDGGFRIAGLAGSLAEARTKLDGVDVAIIDLGLPDGSGAELADLRAANPRAQPLVLSATVDRSSTAQAVERGAAAVLCKTAHLHQIVEAVRRLRAGETLIPLTETVELLRFAGRERERASSAQRLIDSLTAREREVLQLLADGLDGAAVASRLHISPRTQRNHVANILSKLGVHSQLQALVFALRHGVVTVRGASAPAEDDANASFGAARRW